MNRHTIKDRRCGHCKAVFTTDAAGLVARSMERHGKASPPRPVRTTVTPSSFSDMDMMGFLAKFMFGSKRGHV